MTNPVLLDLTDEVHKLASTLKDNADFARCIRAANPALRQSLYNALRPLVSFKAKPYFLMLK